MSGKARMKEVSVKEWNQLNRDLRSLERIVDRMVQELSIVQNNIHVLERTFIVPRGKKLGS